MSDDLSIFENEKEIQGEPKEKIKGPIIKKFTMGTALKNKLKKG